MPIDDIKALLRLPKLRAKREFPFNQDGRTLVFVLDLERIHESLVEKISHEQVAFGYSEETAPDDGLSTLLSDLQVKCAELAVQLQNCSETIAAGVHGCCSPRKHARTPVWRIRQPIPQGLHHWGHGPKFFARFLPASARVAGRRTR